MPDWSASMKQTFEYYIVDPGTWKDAKRLNNVISSSISWDSEADTLGSATLEVEESPGECYVRIYLITIQNGVKESFPLGTFLVQSPNTEFDGMANAVSLDAYTPLLELKEKHPPIGYSLLVDENIMNAAYRLVRENTRAPVVKTEQDTKLHYDFVSETDDTWLTFIKDLLANAKYSLYLDEIGRVLFVPDQDTASLQPVWTYDDSNSSILYPDLTLNHDMYGIPNVVEVIYSNGYDCYYHRAVNDDSNSPTSTVSRGREILYRVTDPELAGNPTESEIKDYAEKLLREMSTLEFKVTYTHGYCPVRVGDCVRLDNTKANLKNVKAKVISQSVKCEPGCPVTETAIFTTKFWR